MVSWDPAGSEMPVVFQGLGPLEAWTLGLGTLVMSQCSTGLDFLVEPLILPDAVFASFKLLYLPLFH